MNSKILNTVIQKFIQNNLNTSSSDLILKGTSFKEVDTREVVEQIESKRRSKKKLPTWFNTSQIYFPNKLNIEQTSSEITAKYKANIISGESIIDITGGFGVDCFYFSKNFKSLVHCEVNNNLSTIVKHNYKQLGVTNVKAISGNGLEYLETSKAKFDWIYIDPSRRHDQKGKVFQLSDCLPNVPKHLNVLFKASSNILIKTSPLLDISLGVNELRHVKKIYVVAVKNEVKELLWVLENHFNGAIQINTVNLKDEGIEALEFNREDEKSLEIQYNAPLNYLYEPNAAILKSGAFNSVAAQYNLSKLHQHSHLYTSEHLIDFPGRRFKVDNKILYNKSRIKKLGIKKANITTRNFPETVRQLRKKFKILDGGNQYLFFTTNLKNEKILLVTSKIK